VLFNSYVFLFALLPVALCGFFVLGQIGRSYAASWLVLVSLVFYAYWSPRFLVILLVSVLFNYSMSELIAARAQQPVWQSWLLGFAVAGNLSALAYYKYFFVLFAFLRVNGLVDVPFAAVVLPLGISFFTFTQIGYLIDTKQGLTKNRGFLNYILFVTFFPHLIAGPILHNREMMPQFADPAMFRFNGTNFAVGSTIFIIGLLKKCVLADPTASVVTEGFLHTDTLHFIGAWHLALAYSLQLYFDFSGYSDMAIGLARLFNVQFPLNFNSPFKATSIIDFWQRWHMTLTRFLTLYIYNPIALAVTRRRVAKGMGATRQAHATLGGYSSMVLFPTMSTMALAGIWHGAGLQFLIFGMLHGTYLSINHAWRIFLGHTPGTAVSPSRVRRVGKILLTYCCVVVAMVFFRAPSTGSALNLLAGMIGLQGGGTAGIPAREIAWLAGLYGIVWGLPNTQEIMREYRPALARVLPGPGPLFAWRMTPGWAVISGVGAAIGAMAVGGTTEFIYFQF
jgi:D-alanyl-lipoteichoic acid acyltransferase DltB (MBOAT superfamily)